MSMKLKDTASINITGNAGSATTATKATQDASGNVITSTYATKTELSDKVDKVSGKSLSTNDFTTALKTKLEGLSNYDDTELSEAIESLSTRIDTLVSGSASTAIDTFNEIVSFLENIEDTESLESIIAGIESKIPTKTSQLTNDSGYLTSVATANGTTLGLVKGGGDVTISSGVITVNDDSHAHVISNVDGLQSALDAKASTAVATTSTAGLMSAADKAALDGLVNTGAEVNQNAFSNVTVGSTTIAADSKTDTLTIAAGSNVTITPDATNDKITIAATNTTYSAGNGLTLSSTTFNVGAGTGISVAADTVAVASELYSKATATTAATAGWYRIATSAASISNCQGIFQITGYVSGRHTTAVIAAGTSYGVADSSNISVLQCSHYSTNALTKVRIVYHTTYSSNYAYLEVYNPSATALPITVKMLGGTGWSLVTPSTAGSVPSGYSSKEATLSNGTIYSEKFSGNGSGLTSLNGSNISSGTVAKARLAAHNHAYTPAGSVSSSFSSGSAAASSSTTTVYSITAVGTLPSCTLPTCTLPTCTLPTTSVSYSSGTLTITHTAGSWSAGSWSAGSFSAGTLPTKGSGVSVATGSHTHTVTGTVSSSFTGTASTATTIS